MGNRKKYTTIYKKLLTIGISILLATLLIYGIIVNSFSPSEENIMCYKKEGIGECNVNTNNMTIDYYQCDSSTYLCSEMCNCYECVRDRFCECEKIMCEVYATNDNDVFLLSDIYSNSLTKSLYDLPEEYPIGEKKCLHGHKRIINFMKNKV